MLAAVIMGWEQPRRSFLSSRRWMRRLLLASFRRMLGFTRNPSGRRVLEKADTSFNTGNPWGFRVSPHFQPQQAGDFAFLRTRRVYLVEGETQTDFKITEFHVLDKIPPDTFS